MSPNEQKITSGRAAMASAWSISSSGVTHTGQPGPVHQRHARRQQLVEAELDDGVRLAAADLHERPRPRRRCARMRRAQRCAAVGVAVLVEELHARRLLAPVSPIRRRYSKTSAASASSRTDGEAHVHEHVVADLRLRHEGQAHLLDDAPEVHPARCAAAGHPLRRRPSCREPRGTSQPPPPAGPRPRPPPRSTSGTRPRCPRRWWPRSRRCGARD